MTEHSVVEAYIMRHKNTAFTKSQNVLGQFVKLGGLFHHFIGNSSKTNNEFRDVLLRIDERNQFINYFISIVLIHRKFCNLRLLGIASSGFNINDYIVDTAKLEILGKCATFNLN